VKGAFCAVFVLVVLWAKLDRVSDKVNKSSKIKFEMGDI